MNIVRIVLIAITATVAVAALLLRVLLWILFISVRVIGGMASRIY